MIGRKRHFEESKSNTSSSINNHIKKSSHSSFRGDKTKRPGTSSTIKKEIICFYNMKRSTCMNCILSKNKKYPTNTFFPCMPSSTI